MKKIILILTSVITLTTAIKAQIPNGNFESWDTSNGYDMPVSWDNFNWLTAPVNIFTCQRGDITGVSDAYIRLISDTVASIFVVPGIAVSGKINPLTGDLDGGFAYSKRPAALVGKWQFMAPGDDHGFISVSFTKWDAQLKKRDTIGLGMQLLDGMEMSWAPFRIPISFKNANNPDSCLIVLSASGDNPLQYSYLYVNDLAFDFGTGMVDQLKAGSFLAFPNPAADLLHLNLCGLTDIVSIQILNLQGEVLDIKATDQQLNVMNVSELASGIYFIRVRTKSSIATQRFSKL